MQLLRLWKKYEHRDGTEWCDISLVFTVDGLERFKDLLTFRTSELRGARGLLRSLALPSEMCWPARRMGLSPWKLQKMLRRLKSYAEWGVKDGEATELPT